AGIRFIGSGVSGGEEGALYGPSLMPGGDQSAWSEVRPLFEAIAARDPDGAPCCRWIGPGGSGHFVKMVHNGIEYGDMQLICEAYDLLRKAGGYSNDRLHELFTKWNHGDLAGYLMEITAAIFAVKEEDGTAVVDRILDKAGQKNTGMWAVRAALDVGNPLSLIGESVFTRMISARRGERVAAARLLSGPVPSAVDNDRLADYVHDALLAARVVSYAQGFSLIADASRAYGWDIDKAGLALIWRGGCIIRSELLGGIARAYREDSRLPNLLMDPRFAARVGSAQLGWRRTVAAAVAEGIPVPAFSSALAYYDSYRCDRLPANLLQAQRDYFGAHTYERTDRPEGEFFHSRWTE
ncbi:MAG: decarboxylating NADP(+)-dependent phosphogluconate dehydrogenase, partial [Alistipes sp.]|nr:decarboxylating NADP(+)-dependent phosphogluconate dehydrogenase [Alistipes sp.]